MQLPASPCSAPAATAAEERDRRKARAANPRQPTAVGRGGGGGGGGGVQQAAAHRAGRPSRTLVAAAAAVAHASIGHHQWSATWTDGKGRQPGGQPADPRHGLARRGDERVRSPAGRRGRRTVPGGRSANDRDGGPVAEVVRGGGGRGSWSVVATRAQHASGGVRGGRGRRPTALPQLSRTSHRVLGHGVAGRGRRRRVGAQAPDDEDGVGL